MYDGGGGGGGNGGGMHLPVNCFDCSLVTSGLLRQRKPKSHRSKKKKKNKNQLQ